MTAESTFQDRFGEWGKYMAAIVNQSVLGEVLITATFIEEQLLRILQFFMVDGRVSKDMVRGPSAAMGSFSAKNHLAYSLGLIDDQEFTSIDAIRRIRNEFAHNISTNFDDPKIRGKMNPLCWAIFRDDIGDFDAYQAFHVAAQRMIMQLLNRSDHVALERRQSKVWPKERTDYDHDPGYDPLDYIY
jgi:hypothetical protein